MKRKRFGEGQIMKLLRLHRAGAQHEAGGTMPTENTGSARRCCIAGGASLGGVLKACCS